MRIQPKPDIDPVGIDAVLARGMETARAVSSLQWATARLPGDLVRELEAHAKRMGTTRSDAIRDCLGIGIEAIRSRDGIPAGRADDLLSAPRRGPADARPGRSADLRNAAAPRSLGDARPKPQGGRR
jgi:hypothetical protein